MSSWTTARRIASLQACRGWRRAVVRSQSQGTGGRNAPTLSLTLTLTLTLTLIHSLSLSCVRVLSRAVNGLPDTPVNIVTEGESKVGPVLEENALTLSTGVNGNFLTVSLTGMSFLPPSLPHSAAHNSERRGSPRCVSPVAAAALFRIIRASPVRRRWILPARAAGASPGRS